MPGQRYTVTTTAVAHSRRRRGWHEAGIGLLDEGGRVVLMVTVGGLSPAEVDRVAGHLVDALAELPAEPPPQPTRLHRAG